MNSLYFNGSHNLSCIRNHLEAWIDHKLWATFQSFWFRKFETGLENLHPEHILRRPCCCWFEDHIWRIYTSSPRDIWSFCLLCFSFVFISIFQEKCLVLCSTGIILLSEGNHSIIPTLILLGFSEYPELWVPLFLVFLCIYTATVVGNLLSHFSHVWLCATP